MEEKDKLLLALAGLYENWRPNERVGCDAPTPAEQRMIAELKAEGSIEGEAGIYRFTEQGYSKYKDRVAALRALPGS